MADIKNSQIEILIDKKIVEEIKKLMIYKAFADEAMSYMLEATKDEWGKRLLLAALNIGAHGIHSKQTADTCPAVTDGVHLWTVNGINEIRTCRHCGKTVDKCPSCNGNKYIRIGLTDYPCHSCNSTRPTKRAGDGAKSGEN